MWAWVFSTTSADSLRSVCSIGTTRSFSFSRTPDRRALAFRPPGTAVPSSSYHAFILSSGPKAPFGARSSGVSSKRTVRNENARSRIRRCVLVVVLIHSACAGSAEQIVLERFFDASRLRDTTHLRSLATVIFEPRERGTVLDLNVSQITRRPVRRVRDAPDGEVIVAISLEGTAGAGDGIRADQLEVEQVTALASVREPDGQVKSKTLIVELERAHQARPPHVTGHWVVTGIVN
jgi:hypothetical protein